MLKLRRRGKTGIWQIRGTVRGKLVRESTGTSSREHAEAILAKRQRQILDREVWGEERTTTFAEAVILYVHEGGERRFLSPLLERFGKLRIADITQSAVAKAAHETYPGRTAAWHVRAVYTPMNAVIRKAHRAGMCQLSVFEKPKVKAKPVVYAQDEWFEKTLPFCRAQLAGIVLFMTFTGARVTEACALLWTDVNLSRAEAILRNTKNGSSRLVKLHQMLAEIMGNLASAKTDDPRVFGYSSRYAVRKALQRACKRAGTPYLSSHKIGRHAFAARLLREGHSLRVVQDAGGWKVARMVSDHYGHLEKSHVESAVLGAKAPLAQIPAQPKPKRVKRDG